jgi:hypothetical protein
MLAAWVKPSRLVAKPVLEDEHHQPVRGADGEQVQQDGGPAITTDRTAIVSSNPVSPSTDAKT